MKSDESIVEEAIRFSDISSVEEKFDLLFLSVESNTELHKLLLSHFL
jgi:hypothetical protein